MTYYSTTYKSVDLVYCGVPLLVVGVEFFPCVDSDGINPPEPAFCIWERVEIGGVDCTELFIKDQRDSLEDELVGHLEGALA